MAYSRIDSGTSVSSSAFHAHARDPLPRIGDEELRSSYRSQLTASTAQGTLFTSGTERSSVMTKTSSRTSVSLYVGAGLTVDEGLSVEDVMGMYEKGFGDSTGAEDNDLDIRHGDDLGDVDHLDEDSRPGTSVSEASRIGNRILEAMSEPLPLPNRGLSIPDSSHHVVRDSAAFFRNSGLPSSLPKEVTGFRLAAEGRNWRNESGLREGAQGKRDSAKLLNNDDQSSIRRQMVESAQSDASPPLPPLPSPPIAGDSSREADSMNQSPQLSSARSPVSPASRDEEDPNSRDRYGFRKKNQYISREQYDTWNDSYEEYIARRRRKWMAYLKDSGLPAENPTQFPPPSIKTKRFIRKGVPPEWRGAAWFYYAGGPGIIAKHPGKYDELLRRVGNGEAKEVDSEAIERDLHRTFPDNIKFKFSGGQPGMSDAGSEETKTEEPAIVSSLRRVLLAFSIYNPRTGYCQSLNFLAGLLLLFVETEEQCFWLLNVIARVFLPGTHEMSLEGSKIDLGVLMAALKESMPAVWSKVGGELEDTPGPNSSGQQTPKLGGGTLGRKAARRLKPLGNRSADALASLSTERLPPITLCMTAWFMSCFIGTLPMETTLRVWDVFFYEGSKTLCRVALAIFKLGEAEIRAVSDPMEMFGVVQALPRRLLDCNVVMETTFRRRNGFGHLSQENIDERRRERRDAIKEARTAGGAAAADGGEPASPVGGEFAADLTEGDVPAVELRRKGTLFGRRRERRPAEIM